MIRNIDNDNSDSLLKAVKDLHVDNIRHISSKDNAKGSIVLYFSSEKLAIDAMKTLRGNMGFKSKKLSITYKEISEYSVRLPNVNSDSNLSVTDIRNVVNSFVKDVPITLEEEVIFIQRLTSDEADLIIKALQLKTTLSIEKIQNDDIGVECISVTDSQMQSLIEDLKVKNLKVKSTTLETNRSLCVGFLNIIDANIAKKLYFDKLFETRINDNNPADISYMTAYALEVFGLSQEESVKNLIESLKLDYKAIKADRCAILKVRRHLEVVPQIKKLKSIMLHDTKLSPSRYYPLSSMNTTNVTDYDNFENQDDEKFDKFSLKKLLKDYLHTDPATRYHIAKNAFERHLAGTSSLQLFLFIIYDK